MLHARMVPIQCHLKQRYIFIRPLTLIGITLLKIKLIGVGVESLDVLRAQHKTILFARDFNCMQGVVNLEDGFIWGFLVFHMF